MGNTRRIDRENESEDDYLTRLRAIGSRWSNVEFLGARDVVIRCVYNCLLEEAERRYRDKEQHTLEGKQALARLVTSVARAAGVTPSLGKEEDGEGRCTVLCVNDRGKGRFLVEWRQTKKRGMSSEHLVDLFDKGLTFVGEDQVYIEGVLARGG